jgi:hypothetical protein
MEISITSRAAYNAGGAQMSIRDAWDLYWEREEERWSSEEDEEQTDDDEDTEEEVEDE